MEIDYDYLRTGTAIGFRASHELCSNYLLLLGESNFWLLVAVSFTRHFPLLAITQRFLYSSYLMKDSRLLTFLLKHSITRHFS